MVFIPIIVISVLLFLPFVIAFMLVCISISCETILESITIVTSFARASIFASRPLISFKTFDTSAPKATPEIQKTPITTNTTLFISKLPLEKLTSLQFTVIFRRVSLEINSLFFLSLLYFLHFLFLLYLLSLLFLLNIERYSILLRNTFKICVGFFRQGKAGFLIFLVGGKLSFSGNHYRGEAFCRRDIMNIIHH